MNRLRLTPSACARSAAERCIQLGRRTTNLPLYSGSPAGAGTTAELAMWMRIHVAMTPSSCARALPSGCRLRRRTLETPGCARPTRRNPERALGDTRAPGCARPRHRCSVVLTACVLPDRKDANGYPFASIARSASRTDGRFKNPVDCGTFTGKSVPRAYEMFGAPATERSAT